MSNLATNIRVAYEPLRSIAFGDVTTSYQAVGDPFANPVRILKVTNLTDQDMLISFDGTTDHDVVAANGFYLYDYASNKSSVGGLLEQPQNNQIYIKAEGTLPGSGNIYVTVVYASQN